MYHGLDLGTSVLKALPLVAALDELAVHARRRCALCIVYRPNRATAWRRGARSAPGRLRPATLWNHGRSSTECAVLDETCPQMPSLTGNHTMPSFTAPKLLWVARHEPDLLARIVALVREAPSQLVPNGWIGLAIRPGALGTDSSAIGGSLPFYVHFVPNNEVPARKFRADMKPLLSGSPVPA